MVAVSYIDSRFLPRTEIVEVCDGIKYELNLQDDVQRFIYFNVCERRGIQKVLPLVSEGGICLDIGANVGFYALHFARQVGNNGKVFAFEPSPEVAAKLRKNVSLNGFEEIVEVEEWAVSDRSGTIEFAISPDENSGWGHIGDDSRFSRKITVRTDTLDNFFERKHIRVVDVMKVDIEGAEDLLIMGAEKILSEKKVRHIYMEFCTMSSEAVRKRVERLHQFGYFPERQDEKILNRMMKDDQFSSRRVQNFLFSCVK
ncbi:MAG: FkbM family methyltransferase [Chloroherpetonaceae bacterium]|nr:FkbM family methyltransferase [Chloroherpetonaceae bacterium]